MNTFLHPQERRDVNGNGNLKKKFPLDFTKFIESHRTIHYWNYSAYNLRPEYLFSSIDKAKKAILKVDKSKRVTILYK